jgi:hypothetical protein
MARRDAHIADCALCQGQLASPQPFHEDLCHMDISPDGDRGMVQCPHLAEPGSKARLCLRHLEGAHESWLRLLQRTASLN